jgi:hypothetical protein
MASIGMLPANREDTRQAIARDREAFQARKDAMGRTSAMLENSGAKAMQPLPLRGIESPSDARLYFGGDFLVGARHASEQLPQVSTSLVVPDVLHLAADRLSLDLIIPC